MIGAVSRHDRVRVIEAVIECVDMIADARNLLRHPAMQRLEISFAISIRSGLA